MDEKLCIFVDLFKKFVAALLCLSSCHLLIVIQLVENFVFGDCIDVAADHDLRLLLQPLFSFLLGQLLFVLVDLLFE